MNGPHSWGMRSRPSSFSCVLIALLIAGAVLRIVPAERTFLNPDEALHYFVSAQTTFSGVYRASLTTAHPPLMFFILHPWIKAASSEFLLRLPFVLSGMLFCWILFSWVVMVAGRGAALSALGFCLLSPSLISLSAEVRQYSLLLLFCAASLYCLEKALEEESARWTLFSFLSLYLALLTHYSALIFATALGIYGLLRLLHSRITAQLWTLWICGQAGALGLLLLLFKTQISALRQSGIPAEIASTWLRAYVYKPGKDHLLTFAVTHTVRLFRYFVSHGTIGVLFLLTFLIGILMLFAGRAPALRPQKTLAIFLCLPFLLTLLASLLGAYPYGGIRHDSLLVIMAATGVAIGIDALSQKAPLVRRNGIFLMITLLLIANLFPSPTGPYIRPRDQKKGLMLDAISFLQQQRDSVILTDYPSGLVMGFYLCGGISTLPFGPTAHGFVSSRCGNRDLITSVGSQAGFQKEDIAGVVGEAWKSVPAATASIWLFQTGWIDSQDENWSDAQKRTGCETPIHFGRNVRLCRLKRPDKPA
jgi:4-amino-4-deoxy-L-arabinose transferase-like glycosyltransferase